MVAPFLGVNVCRLQLSRVIQSIFFPLKVECGLCVLWAMWQPFVCHMEESNEWWGATLAGVYWYTGSPIHYLRV